MSVLEAPTTKAPVVPELEDQGYDRMTHIVLEGFDPEEEGGEFTPAGPTVVESLVLGTPVTALCGKTWVPDRNPDRYPLCPTCKNIAEENGWGVPIV